jgi:hypothetical protein
VIQEEVVIQFRDLPEGFVRSGMRFGLGFEWQNSW